ncbi:MAG: ABC transporter ATP-binding protein [Deltaproteobacteria bacterium]|nr:ABC transporter ATP-binding protein [Deltaproteobacteria bacterium]
MALIQVRGLHKRFGDGDAVQGVDLSIEKGEIFGLIGPDGAGKSTLIRMLAGILEPTEGEISLRGINVVKNYEEARSIVGYMPQTFGLYGLLTVEENLRAVARIHGVLRAEFQKRIKRLYQFSGLGPFRDRRATQLSGGMRQKLGLSCVLVHQPPILLLDEPTVGVDPVSRREFWDILHSFSAQGTTILISTPYLEEAERCHRIAFLHEGRILETLDPRELRTRFPYATCDIYAPDMRKLLMHLKERLKPPVAFLSGDHIHLICDKKAVSSGKLERAVKKLSPKGSQLKETPPTVQDLYFILEQKGRES